MHGIISQEKIQAASTSTAHNMKSETLSTFADERVLEERDMVKRSHLRRRVIVGLFVLLCYLFYAGAPQMLQRMPCHSNTPRDLAQAPLAVKQLVPLEAHIMSKCPDARDCLHDLVLPTMQRTLDKVNFTLSYIGT
jgi:hypothetical protein